MVVTDSRTKQQRETVRGDNLGRRLYKTAGEDSARDCCARIWGRWYLKSALGHGSARWKDEMVDGDGGKRVDSNIQW